jgi:trehalose 2-sulfotransferase
MRPSRSYLICCSERTGSTLLGNALISTGIAGYPRSYFNQAAHHDPGMHRLLGNARDDDEYLDKVIVAATTPNGVFGARVHWSHFLNLIAKAEHDQGTQKGMTAVSVPERLRVHLPDLRYVYLIRRNAVARAISHYRAKKTDRWRLDSRWVTDDMGGEGEPDFDFDEIHRFVRLGETEDSQWRSFFRQHHVQPLELIYEEVVQDIEGTVGNILGYLGIPAENINLPPPTLRAQADDRSREWEARYRRMREDEST